MSKILKCGVSQYVRDYRPTGSWVMCDPPVLNTDKDYIILVNDFDSYAAELQDDYGFECTTGEYPIPADEACTFSTFRRGDINLIVTENKGFFDSFCDATVLSTKLNLLDKKQRITLFQYVLYGNLLDQPTCFGVPV